MAGLPGEEAVLIVRENGARAGDTLYLTGTIGERRLDDEAAGALLRGIRQMFAPGALADTAGGIISAAREIAAHTGLGFRIIEEAIPVDDTPNGKSRSAGERPHLYSTRGGYLFASARQHVPTMTITIDGVRVTPVGELVRTGQTIERNGSAIDAEECAADTGAP